MWGQSHLKKSLTPCCTRSCSFDKNILKILNHFSNQCKTRWKKKMKIFQEWTKKFNSAKLNWIKKIKYFSGVYTVVECSCHVSLAASIFLTVALSIERFQVCYCVSLCFLFHCSCVPLCFLFVWSCVSWVSPLASSLWLLFLSRDFRFVLLLLCFFVFLFVLLLCFSVFFSLFLRFSVFFVCIFYMRLLIVTPSI